MLNPGLPDFSWRSSPKRGKLYQNTTKYTKGQQTIPNDHKICKNANIFFYTVFQNILKNIFLV
jgi:hypothetical protein